MAGKCVDGAVPGIGASTCSIMCRHLTTPPPVIRRVIRLWSMQYPAAIVISLAQLCDRLILDQSEEKRVEEGAGARGSGGSEERLPAVNNEESKGKPLPYTGNNSTRAEAQTGLCCYCSLVSLLLPTAVHDPQPDPHDLRRVPRFSLAHHHLLIRQMADSD